MELMRWSCNAKERTGAMSWRNLDVLESMDRSESESGVPVECASFLDHLWMSERLESCGRLVRA
jgi:hypothetical protein